MKKIRTLLLTFIAMAVFTWGGDTFASEFKIKPGDVLQVTVWKEEGMDHEVAVLPDGSISFPLINTINIQDLSTSEAAAKLKEKLKRFIPDASVSVIVKAPLGHTVNVIGQVTKPGELVMGRRITALQALSQAGGLTPYADDDNIKIIRKKGDKEVSIEFPYDDISRGRDLEKNIALEPGDVIVVPTAGLF